MRVEGIKGRRENDPQTDGDLYADFDSRYFDPNFCRTCQQIGKPSPKRCVYGSSFCEEHFQLRKGLKTERGVRVTPALGGVAPAGPIENQLKMTLSKQAKETTYVEKAFLYALAFSVVAELTFVLLFVASFSVEALENSDLFFPGSPVSGLYQSTSQFLAPLIYKSWVTIGIWTTINVDLLLSAVVIHFKQS